MVLMYLLSFVLGTAIGSFINMLVWRVPRRESLLGRSYCDKTHTPLSGADLVPVFSFLINRGKCRHCGIKLPLIYPAVEFLSGITYLLIFIKFYNPLLSFPDFPFRLITALIISSIFIYLGALDLTNWKLDKLSIGSSLFIGGLMNLFALFVFPGIFDPAQNSLGFIIGFILVQALIVMSKGKGLNFEDSLLGGLTGLLTGIQGLLYTLFIASVSGFLIYLIQVILKKANELKTAQLPFAPFVAWGVIVYLLVIWAF